MQIRFKFMFRPEYIKNNSLFIFRENNAKDTKNLIYFLS